MRAARVIRKVVVGLVAAVGLAAVAMYLLASRVPSGYSPTLLSRREKDSAMREFRRRLMDFSNEGQRNEPFTWSVGQEEINRYLDAMDEIAVESGAAPGTVDRAMRKVGLSEPAVALENGSLKLMVRSTKHEKILSARLGFDVTPAGKLRVRMVGVQVGRLPIPALLVRGRIEKLKAALSRPLKGSVRPAAGPSAGFSSADVGEVVGRVIAAIDGQPIDTEFSWKVMTRKRVRIAGIHIADGEMTLHIVPVEPAGRNE